jgi:hypothetical protein
MNINGLIDVQIDGINMDDYPDFVDAYVSFAIDEEGNILTDEQLDQLAEDNPEWVQEMAHDEIMGRA